MKKKYIILCVLIGVILVGFFLSKSKQQLAQEGETVATLAEQPPVGEDRPYIEAFGLVKPTTVTNINIDFPARIRRFYVKEGDRVRQGQVLLALDVDEYRTEIRNTEYELQTTRYELKKIESEAAQLTAKIAEKEAQLSEETAYELQQIRADLAKARQDLAKKKELLALKAISASEVAELEKTIADLNRSYEQRRSEKEEEIKQLKAELALIKGETKSSAEPEVTNISMLKAKITLLEEKLAMLRKKLDQDFIRNDEIIAPIDNSVVYEIGYAEGDLVTVERKVLSLINLDSLVVKANIPEEFVKDLHLGAEAVITPVADYNRIYHGKVIHRAQVADKADGETIVRVEISIEDRDEFLLPHFNVDVKIYTD